VDCLKFNVGVVQECKMTGLHADKSKVARLTKHHFPKGILEHKRNKNPQNDM
jgi:hypothetical protein